MLCLIFVLMLLSIYIKKLHFESMELRDIAVSAPGGVTYCDPCENEGRYIQAGGYCVECDDYLCKDCFRIHRRPVLWRNHVLLGKPTMPKMKLMKGSKDDCIEPCSQHPMKILEYFCHSHDCLACSLCVFRNHRHCDNVDYIPDIAELFFESEEMKVLNESFACLLKDINSHSELAEIGIAKVQEFQMTAFSKINMLRLEIGHILDKLSQDIIFMGNKDCINLRDSISVFKQIGKEVKARTTSLEKKQNERKLSQLFVEVKSSKMALQLMADKFNQTKSGCRVQQYEVNINKNSIMEVRKCLVNVCRLDTSERFLENEETMFVSDGITCTKASDVKSGSLPERMAENGESVPSWKDIGRTKHKNEDIVQKSEQEMTQAKARNDTHCSNMDIKNKTHDMKLQVEDQCTPRPSDHSSIRQYDRETLLKFQTSFHALHKPAGILDVPEIVFDEPQDLYLQLMKVESERRHQNASDFRRHDISGEQYTKQKREEIVKEQSKSDLQPMPIQTQEEVFDTKIAEEQNDPNLQEQPKDETVSPDTLKITCRIKSKLYTMIVTQKQDDQSIIEWIDNNIDESRRSGASFVCALMENVCRFSSEKADDGRCLFHLQNLLDRKDLLHRYIRGSAKLELEAVRTLQNFIAKYKHPQGLLHEAFDVLLGAGILSEDTLSKSQCMNAASETRETTQLDTYDFRPQYMSGVQYTHLKLQGNKPKLEKHPFTKISKKLYELIVVEAKDNHSIIEWIDSTISSSQRSGEGFANVLMYDICMISCEKDSDGGLVFHPKKLLDRKELLHKYISRQKRLELEALRILQMFVEKKKQPHDVLQQAYDILKTAGIVSKRSLSEHKKAETKKVCPKKEPKQPSKFKQPLYELIVKEKKDDQSVIDWIESNVDETCKTGVNFVSSLMANVCRFSSEKDDNNEWTFNPDMIRERKLLLLKYIDGNIDLQLQVLFAVQTHIEKFKQPPDMLRQTFGVLYCSEIISENAFIKWEASEEKPEISEECLKQTRLFFTGLRTWNDQK